MAIKAMKNKYQVMIFPYFRKLFDIMWKTLFFCLIKKLLVQTEASPSWTTLFWQRLRWAGKSTAYRDFYLIAFQALVFLFCLLLWLVTIIGLFDLSTFPVLIVVAWSIKAVTDRFY